MKQFEAHGTMFFFASERPALAGVVQMQPTSPGGAGFTCAQASLEAFCEQIPDGVVARLRVRAEAAEAAVGVADLEAEAAEVRSVESDVSFLRAELSKAQDRIKVLEAHIADRIPGGDSQRTRNRADKAEARVKELEAHILGLQSDARTAKRVREAIVSDVLKALEPYRRV